MALALSRKSNRSPITIATQAPVTIVRMKATICQLPAISQIKAIDSASNAHFEGNERRLANGAASSICFGRISTPILKFPYHAEPRSFKIMVLASRFSLTLTSPYRYKSIFTIVYISLHG
jgi:hypothetical protein